MACPGFELARVGVDTFGWCTKLEPKQLKGTTDRRGKHLAPRLTRPLKTIGRAFPLQSFPIPENTAEQGLWGHCCGVGDWLGRLAIPDSTAALTAGACNAGLQPKQRGTSERCRRIPPQAMDSTS